MGEFTPYINCGDDFRNLLDLLSGLASDKRAIQRHLLRRERILLKSETVKACFSTLSGHPEVLPLAGEMLEEEVTNLFPELTLWVDGEKWDISSYVASLAAGKDPGCVFELGPMADSASSP